jgi:dGTPase
MAINWNALLSNQRLCRDKEQGYEDNDRDDFERDFDRIIFSSAFRRLKDKTQVYPLSKNDYTRTRLTHSLEVAGVGRSLGRKVQRALERAEKIEKGKPEFAAVVAAACLAHDIGNPPFGHSGESAIQAWAKKNVGTDKAARFQVTTPQQAADLTEFEGNAQGMRVLSKLQSRRRHGGMQLTIATLGAMMKYPCPSVIDGAGRDRKRVEQKKFGYFADDSQLILPALRGLEMQEYAPGAFRRHPLAFLVEAADDICYALVDLEDSVDQKVITENEAFDLMTPLAQRIERYRDKGYDGKHRLEWLRAYSINVLVKDCASVFESKYDDICNGSFHESLVKNSESAEDYERVISAVRKNAYKDRRVLEVEAAGHQVICGLLDYFAPSLISFGSKNDDDEKKRMRWLFPASYLHRPGEAVPSENLKDVEWALESLSTYQRLLAVTDYISGMTDSFAVDLYQKLSGIRLPS